MKCIKIHLLDSVAVAVKDLVKGETASAGGKEITVIDGIPAGHKFALRDIPQDENIIKYAYPVLTFVRYKNNVGVNSK